MSWFQPRSANQTTKASRSEIKERNVSNLEEAANNAYKERLAAMVELGEYEKKALKQRWENALYQGDMRRASIFQASRIEEFLSKLTSQACIFRPVLFWVLTFLLIIEIVAVFFVVYASGGQHPKLFISDSTLKVIVGSTVVQTSVMVISIIKSVFPSDLKSLVNIGTNRIYQGEERLQMSELSNEKKDQPDNNGVSDTRH